MYYVYLQAGTMIHIPALNPWWQSIRFAAKLSNWSKILVLTSANISTNLKCAIWQVNSCMKERIIIMCWNVSQKAFGQESICGVNLCYFRDALHDPSTGLTFDALTVEQKQLVLHCEEIFSRGARVYAMAMSLGQTSLKLLKTGVKPQREETFLSKSDHSTTRTCWSFCLNIGCPGFCKTVTTSLLTL